MRASDMPGAGSVLDGKYRLVRLLGEGGMAHVYEAVHEKLGQRVAVKILVPELASDDEIVARFEREARAVAQLRTPHVAHVIDVDTSGDGFPYIVMEFLEGRDLDGELEARGALPVDEAVDYILQACGAMHEAHAAGIVHRDLKPANLFVVRQGATRMLKVLDFGISKILGDANKLTAATAVMGTVLYMSPEQVRATSKVDVRADIWSLGVILHELLAGRPPWEGTAPQVAAMIVSSDPPRIETIASVPEGVAFAVRRMLERDPARRFASVNEVVQALGSFATAGSLGAQIAARIGPTSSTRNLSPRQVRTEPLRRGQPTPTPGSLGPTTPQPFAYTPSVPPSNPGMPPSSSPDLLHGARTSDPSIRTATRGSRRFLTGVAVGFLLVAVLGLALIALSLGRGGSKVRDRDRDPGADRPRTHER